MAITSSPSWSGRGLRRLVVAISIALAAILAPAPRALAESGSWNANAAGNWSGTSSWLRGVIPGSTTATNSTDIATFGFTLTADRIVTVDANRNIAGIIFSNTSAFRYTLSSGNLLLSNGGVIQSATNNGAHTDTISSAIAIQGVGGSGTFTAGATNAASLLSIGAVTGVSTAGNTTTLTLNGDNTGANAVTGVIGNGGAGGRLAVVKSGNGVWQLSGANTFSGGLTLNSGTLQLGNNAALGSGTFTIAGGAIDVTATRTTTNNNAQAWNGDFTFAGSNTLDLGTGAVALGASRTVTVNASTLTVGGVISGAGFGLTKAGAGGLTLSGANTFSGGVTLNAGKLTINNSSALGSGTFTIAGDGTVQIDTSSNPLTLANAQNWNADFAYSTGVGNRTINLNGNVTLGSNRTVTVSGNGSNTLAVGGIISDGGNGYSLTKTGGDTLQLTGANTYTGITRINAGTLIVTSLGNGGAASPLGASSNAASNLVIDGGTLQLNTNSSSTDRLFTIGANGVTLNANVSSMTFTNTGALAFTGSGARTLTLTEGNRTGSLAAAIGDGTGGATSLVKSGGSTDASGWTLSGNNTYTGQTTLNGWGSLNLNSATALGNTSKINFRNTGVTSGATILNFQVAPSTDYSSVFSTDPNQVYRIGTGSGVSTTLGANLTSAGGVFEKLGSGTLTLSGSNSFVNATVSQGTLLITRAAALGSGTVSLKDTVTLASTSTTAITISNPVAFPGFTRLTFGSTFGTGDLIFTGPMSAGVTAPPSRSPA